MSRISTLLTLACAAIAALVLFRISYEVEHAREELIALNAEIAAERDAIRLLQAEWAFLTRPDRLSALAERRLGLVAPTPEHRLEMDAMLAMLEDAPAPADEPAPTLEPERPAGPALLANAEPQASLEAAPLDVPTPLRAPPRQVGPGPGLGVVFANLGLAEE